MATESGEKKDSLPRNILIDHNACGKLKREARRMCKKNEKEAEMHEYAELKERRKRRNA